MIKEAVLLGANEEQASKETAEVMQLMEKLTNLTEKHQEFAFRRKQLNKVGDLKEVFPEVLS